MNYKIIEKNNDIFFKYLPKKNKKKTDKKKKRKSLQNIKKFKFKLKLCFFSKKIKRK